jgi:hypothetical protein
MHIQPVSGLRRMTHGARHMGKGKEHACYIESKPKVFEKEFAEKVGIAHAVAVSSGTADMPRLNTLGCPAEFNRVNPGEIRSDKLNAACCDFVNLTRYGKR